MIIQFNGEPREIESGTSIALFIDQLQLSGRRIAVELNGEILPRSEHPRTLLHAGDRIEIVHAIGGGQHEDND